MAHPVVLRSAITLTFVVIVSFFAMACHEEPQPLATSQCIPLNGTSANATLRNVTTTYIYANNELLVKVIRSGNNSCMQYFEENGSACHQCELKQG
jgi:hypothetical protein